MGIIKNEEKGKGSNHCSSLIKSPCKYSYYISYKNLKAIFRECSIGVNAEWTKTYRIYGSAYDNI